jgi:hypothetical protein
MTAQNLTITKLARSPEGFWRARVSSNGTTIDVDMRYGSWQATVRPFPRSRSLVRRDVLPFVAAALQAKVRPVEKREARTGSAE